MVSTIQSVTDETPATLLEVFSIIHLKSFYFQINRLAWDAMKIEEVRNSEIAK